MDKDRSSSAVQTLGWLSARVCHHHIVIGEQLWLINVFKFSSKFLLYFNEKLNKMSSNVFYCVVFKLQLFLTAASSTFILQVVEARELHDQKALTYK